MRTSYLLLLLAAAAIVAVRSQDADGDVGKLPEWATETAFKNFTRHHASMCALDCVDGLMKTRNSRGSWVFVIGEKDGCIDIHEIGYGKQAYLTPGQQAMSVFVKPDAQIMKDCNNNSAEEKKAGESACIDYNDMLLSVKGCVAGEYRLHMFRDYICHNCRDKFFKAEASASGHKRALLEWEIPVQNQTKADDNITAEDVARVLARFAEDDAKFARLL